MRLYDKSKDGVYFIAEMSANHGGKLENALEIVRAAKKAGADCLKIQTYTADTMTIDCDNEYFRIKGGLWDGYKLYDLYQEASTPWEWQETIKQECEALGMDFLSTPFDTISADFLESLGVGFYKIASFELVDIPLISYVASKGKPMLISCGMGSVEEITDAVTACHKQGNYDIILLKCCSEYPANPADMNLAVLTDMRERFQTPVGFSDHSPGHQAAVVAAALGACVIEKHLCLDRKIQTPDSAFSMEPQEFAKMVQAVNATRAIMGKATYALIEHEKESTVFRRSLFAVQDIEQGQIITREMVRSIRPGYGAPPKKLEQILGKPSPNRFYRGEPL